MKSFCYYTTLIVVFVAVVAAVAVVVVIIVDFIVIVTPRRRRHFNKRTPVLLLPLLACILFFFFYNSSRADSFCWPAPNTSHQFTQCARQMNVDRVRCQTSQKHPSTGTKALPAAEATQCRQQRQLRVANVRCSMSAPSDAIKFNFSVAKIDDNSSICFEVFPHIHHLPQVAIVCACRFPKANSSGRRTAPSSSMGVERGALIFNDIV